MGLQVDRQNGQNYSDNIVDELLAFDRSQTWTVSGGTGSGTLTTALFYQGVSSLKLLNTAPTTDLTVTNAVQSTIVKQSGNYGFSLYLRKTQALEIMTLEVAVFQNAVPFNTQTFVLGNETAEDDLDDVWVRFDSFVGYGLLNNDEITFTFTLKGKTGTALLNTSIWIDGIMLYNKERLNVIPPDYIKPVYNNTLQTPLPVVEDLTADSYSLSALNTAPASAVDTGTLGEIRITATHIYVCTATDVWVRAALATW